MKRKVFAVLLVIVIMSVFIGCNKEASISSNGAEKQQDAQQSIVLNQEEKEELSTEPSTNVTEEPTTEKADKRISEKESIPEATKSNEPSKKSNSEKSSSSAPSAKPSYIGAEKAKSIALNHAGISEAEAKFLEIELDRDDYIKKYEVSFHFGDFEYDYDINAETGEIISAEKEYDSIYD